MNYMEVSLEPKTFSLISTYETTWSQTKTEQNKQKQQAINPKKTKRFV